ncbi:MAG TPA: DHHA1 domain-containing protein, partial [Crocinitomicaceae bacterium]|nr:DHHA1 domain-containing protein [Crocinitomicaceae bacterium]
KLLEIGVKHNEIHERVFDVNTKERLQLRGFVLNEKLEIVSPEVVVVSLSKAEAERFNMQKGDTEGLVNEALSIQGMKIAAFFNEADEYVKISFRSKGTNNKVNLLSQNYFNGGGHINAAGGRFDGNISDAIALFKEKVYEFLDKE